MEYKKTAFACISGIITTFVDQYLLIFVLVCAGIIIDCISGLIKVFAIGQKLSSKKGTQGFWKKTGFIMAFGFGIFLDAFIPVMLDIISITLPFACPFGMIIGIYIILNESISIIENLVEINPNAVPKWLLGLLKSTANKLDEKEK